MPKFSEETEEKIIELIEQGYKNAEISRQLGIYRGAVSKRRKNHLKRKPVHKNIEMEKEETIQKEQVVLSDSAMRRLYQLHALLGTNSLEEMIETVYADQSAANKYRLKYMEEIPDAEAPKTFAGIIAEETGYAADLKYDLDIYMEGFREDRRLMEELKDEAERQYEAGYKEGKNDHALLFPCGRCGEPLTIKPGTEIHRLIVEFLREKGIVHEDCLPSYERILLQR